MRNQRSLALNSDLSVRLAATSYKIGRHDQIVISSITADRLVCGSAARHCRCVIMETGAATFIVQLMLAILHACTCSH